MSACWASNLIWRVFASHIPNRNSAKSGLARPNEQRHMTSGQILAGLLNMIAQKVPSDTMVEAQGRQKALQKQGIIK